MSDDKPGAKWEAKQRAAKEAEAKFEANQAKAKQRKHKRVDKRDDAIAEKQNAKAVGMFAWLAAHKLVVAALVVILAGGVIFTMCKVVKHQMRNAPGAPRGEVFVAGTLILMDYVEIGGTDSKGRAQQSTASGVRLTAVDATTGAQLAVDVDGEYKSCYPGGTRLVCIDIYDRLELLDPKTLAVTHEAEKLIAAAKLAKPTRRIETSGEFVVVLEDGRGAKIDPSTATVEVLDSVPSSFGIPPRSGCDVGYQLKLGNTLLKFDDGGTRQRLTSVPPPPAESATPSGPALTFLEPRFLANWNGLPLVLHRAALGDKIDHVISRVDGISKEVWQVPLGGECRRAIVNDQTLVVATDNPARRAVGIDVSTGRVAWTFGR